MASVEKFAGRGAVSAQIRHIERINTNYSNEDVDLSRKCDDYILSPDRGMSSYDYYKDVLSRTYVYGRKDVVTACGWVITLPTDVPPEKEGMFFDLCYDFLNRRYGGEQNCISCVVHRDEGGQPHMHYLFTPIVEDTKHAQGQKVCCDKVLNRKEYRNFHPDLDRFLRQRGLACSVYTGVTARQGGNRTVEQLKATRKMDIQTQIQQEVTKQIAQTQREKQFERKPINW